jgi:hypothetical protein
MNRFLYLCNAIYTYASERVAFIEVILNILFTPMPTVSLTLISVIDMSLMCCQLQVKLSDASDL